MFIAVLFARAKRETTQAVHQQTNKQNMVCMYKRILFSLKMEGNSNIWYDLDES